jgi:short-subunit dehydrogenase
LGRNKPALDIPHIVLDLTSAESIQSVIQTIQADYPEFDCLVHCAGDGQVELINDIDFTEADMTFRLNVV